MPTKHKEPPTPKGYIRLKHMQWMRVGDFYWKGWRKLFVESIRPYQGRCRVRKCDYIIRRIKKGVPK